MPDAAPSGKTLLGRIKDLAPFGILITVFMAGFGMSTFQVGHDLRRKDEQLAQKDNEARLRAEEHRTAVAELQQTRLDLARLRELRAPSVGEAVAARGVPGSSGRKQASQEIKPRPGTERDVRFDSEEISLQTGKSGPAFEGDIVISLIAVPFGGDPLRHRVVANIGSPGRLVTNLNVVDVGHATSYITAKATYEIRVTGADTLSAKFLVSRL